MNTKSILLVEDDPRDVALTLSALEERRFASKVFVVHDGEAALDYLRRRGKFQGREGGQPIVVLLDNKMPKLSGLDVLKSMKTDDLLKSIPVVVLTSSCETPDLTEFYRCGANAYVVKPVNASEFIETIKNLGLFWLAINEPPPIGQDTSVTQTGRSTSVGSI